MGDRSFAWPQLPVCQLNWIYVPLYSFRSGYLNRKRSDVLMICEEQKRSDGEVHSWIFMMAICHFKCQHFLKRVSCRATLFSGEISWTGFICSLTKSFDLSAVGTFQAPNSVRLYIICLCRCSVKPNIYVPVIPRSLWDRHSTPKQLFLTGYSQFLTILYYKIKSN